MADKRDLITVIGACNVDLITYVSRFPKPGETIRGVTHKKGFGGKGANQAVQAAKLGASVHMISKLGQDVYASETRSNFTKSGVDHTKVFTCADPEIPSGLAPITVETSTGQNSIVIIGGANDELTVEEIESCREIIRRSSWLVVQLEIPQEMSLQAMRIASEEKTKVLFNPAPGVSELSQEFFTLSDLVVLNETELELITQKKVTNSQEAKQVAPYLIHSLSTKAAVVTLGSEGAFYISKEENFSVEGVKVDQVVDTTGAGDSFIGSLVYFLFVGTDIRRALQMSNQIAALSVQSKGTQSSYPDRSVLKSLQ
ncbi:ribokinase [Planoprotostelium fungivorum]|uniref:Ribokinase n=1 Tax=Planoprotostelium fungivorum TaxID=1890364 RepID=A0A2P6NYA4_9EUKA|nr:ribokinase [Planoprotostelium fungivorum]